MMVMHMLARIENALVLPEHIRHFADPVFRGLTSLIFIVGGVGHFGQHRMMLDRMAESPWRDVVEKIGSPSLLLWMSGAVFVVFGITLALGLLTRLSALLLFVTLVPVTIVVHVAPGHVGPFFKNIAIMGALIFFFAHGSGRHAIDTRVLRIKALSQAPV